MERNHMLAAHRDEGDSTSTHDANALGPAPLMPHQGPNPINMTSHSNTLASPPTYSHSAASIQFPDVPAGDLVLPPPNPSLHQAHNIGHGPIPLDGRRHNRLPPLSSLTGGEPLLMRGDLAMHQHQARSPPQQAPQWAQGHANRTLPPFGQIQSSTMGQRADSVSTIDFDNGASSVASAASPDRYLDTRSGSVSLDDPDVRLAAEALGDLRADFVSSPPNANAGLPTNPSIMSPQGTGTPSADQAPGSEPLLALLTTSHPFLATTIGGASSAYGGAKNFSPRFKSSAEYVEGYLTPIANTVNTVGRKTGVEGGVRWFLGGGRRNGSSSSDIETGPGSKKRRKVDTGNGTGSNKRLEIDTLKQNSTVTTQPLSDFAESTSTTPRGDRRLSMASTIDSLPAYDEVCSPAYTEKLDSQQGSQVQTTNAPWQSRLIMSTSGLSVAMSEESLRSLKYCLRWLRWANEHMARIVGALKETLEQFEQTNGSDGRRLVYPDEKHQHLPIVGDHMARHPEDPHSQAVARINSLKRDLLKTLQDVINTVSKYAGGALPENARVLVRRHLTSLPQRFRLATRSEGDEANGQDGSANGNAALREGAQKILVLGKEGLDMVSQISGVVDGTIVSAEEWCDRMGKKRAESAEQGRTDAPTPGDAAGDVKMG